MAGKGSIFNGAVMGVLFAVLMAVAPDAGAMDAAAFQKFMADLEEESFSQDQINLLKTCASTNTFTCRQIGKILGLFSFGGDKLKALAEVKTRIEDPQNRHTLLGAFTFDGDKKKAERIIAGMAEASPPRGPVLDRRPLIVKHTGAWDEPRLSALVKQISGESFSDGKLRVLRLALKGNPRGFSSPQVLRLLGSFGFDSDMVDAVHLLDTRILGLTSAEILPILKRFSFSQDRLKVLTAMKDAISDGQNKFTILKGFTFSGDKEKARLILESVKARSCLYGTVRSRGVVFVVDTSGSMNATFKTNRGKTLSRLDFVLRELRAVLREQLHKDSAFNIVTFSSAVRLWKTAPVKATAANIQDALGFLKGLRADGATNIYDALAQGIAQPGVDTVYFLTDGKPTAGPVKDPKAILQDVSSWCAARKVTVHAIAFLMGSHSGDDKVTSRSLMLSLAMQTEGVYRALE